MLRNYWKIALRNIWKHKVFSMINISGIAIGMAACLLILQYVSFKLSYDQFNEHVNDIYRVVNDRYQGGKLIQHGTITYSGVGRAMNEDFAEVVDNTRVMPGGEKILEWKDKKLFEEYIYYADNRFLSIFSYGLKAGDTQTALRDPYTVILTESLARKLFDYRGNDWDSFIGRTLVVQRDSMPYRITAIANDVPENSHLRFNMLISYQTVITWWAEADHNFTHSDFWHYVRLKEGTDGRMIDAKLGAFSKRHFEGARASGNGEEEFYLQPLRRAHLYSDFEYEIGETGNATVVWGLLLIALFIVAIAWVNYINLATARSVDRAREVGIRKVIGSSRAQLVAQFMSESVLVNTIGLLLALGLVYLAQPYFNQLLQYQLSLAYLTAKGLNGYAILTTLVVIVVGGVILSGLYPAFVLSSFKPISVLKGRLSTSKRGVVLRKVLVVTQFSITVALMIGSVVAVRQIKYMQEKDLGFNMEQVMLVKPPVLTEWDSTFITRTNTFKDELKALPGVVGAATSWSVPGGELGRSFNMRRADAASERYTFRQTGIDYDYFDVYGVKLLAGRNFTPGDHNPDFDKLRNAILNRSAAKLLGFSSPSDAVGKQIMSGDRKWDVIGVVEDYHQKSLKYPLEPIWYRPAYSTNSTISVKIKPGHVKRTIDDIRSKYEAFFPGNLFAYSFIDDSFNKQYENEQLFAKAFGFFALLAIFVASLGLFGLAMFSTVQRTKEIGVRKVLGATVNSIVVLVSKDFIKLIVVANLIAFPVAGLVMNWWLRDFSYRVNVSWWIYLAAGGGALMLALATISVQAVKTALLNPVTSLRSE
jgi:putative ABC transport system permease protein